MKMKGGVYRNDGGKVDGEDKAGIKIRMYITIYVSGRDGCVVGITTISIISIGFNRRFAYNME